MGSSIFLCLTLIHYVFHVSDCSNTCFYLLTKIPASMTNTLQLAGEGDVTWVLLFLFNMHTCGFQFLQSCSHLLHSPHNSLEEEQSSLRSGDSRRGYNTNTHLLESCYCTSHSSRALRAKVWLVGCFHSFNCFFCCFIVLWRCCNRLSFSAQAWWICSAP